MRFDQYLTPNSLIHYSCVDVSSKQANNRLAKRGGHTMAITPRHYLDFINQYANLFNEKRSELEEQQMHLNVGLRKIKETVDQVNAVFVFALGCLVVCVTACSSCSCLTIHLSGQKKKVEELRRDLRIKSQELEAKNAAANDKLKKMIKDQQEAEKKKVHRKEIAFFSVEMNAVLFAIG